MFSAHWVKEMLQSHVHEAEWPDKSYDVNFFLESWSSPFHSNLFSFRLATYQFAQQAITEAVFFDDLRLWNE